MKKRIFALMLAAVLLAALATPALAAAPRVIKVEYEGKNKVEVDFAGKVTYKAPKVTVKDSAGKRLAAKITDRDRDDIDFRVTGLKAGKKYTFTLSGVRAGKSGSYGKVKGSFKVPAKAAKLAIRKVEYDREDQELDIDFNGKVTYKAPKVTVKDAAGKSYSARITEKDRDDMEVKVKGLRRGAAYTVTVTGVALQGGAATKVSKRFTVK